MLRRRIPRLQKKIVNAGLIDGTDRRTRVGVRREQGALRVRENTCGFLQKPDTIHARHALVGQKQSYAVVAYLQLLEYIQSLFRSIVSDDPVFRPVSRAQVSFNSTQDVGV